MAYHDVRPCPGCRSIASKYAGEARGYQPRRCSACATVFTARLPDSSELLDYDSYYHEGNLRVPAFVLTRLEEQVAELERYDGSAPGWMLPVVPGR